MTRDHWFEDLADHLGSAYLRYSFTKGTEQEVAFLIDALGLEPGMRVLDVGCGPGRHAHALGRRGITVHGVDIAQRFVDLARTGAPDGVTFERLDARHLPFDAEFDAAVSLCQGAFGLSAGGASSTPDAGPDEAGAAVGAPSVEPDAAVLAGVGRALRPGGRAALTAFSAYFQVRWLDEHMSFDAHRGVNHERTELRDEDGRTAVHDLWTACFTPRELRLMVAAAGLRTEAMWAARPGQYGRRPPDLDHEELLVIVGRPPVEPSGSPVVP